MHPTLQILEGDSRETLKSLPDESVHCVVTSPPYWGLRDYGVDGQMGLEDSLDDWLKSQVEIFREVRRVLRADGTCWVNVGDAYNSGRPGAQGDTGRMKDRSVTRHRTPGHDRIIPELKHKDMIGQPWRLALALQADGWFLRRDIIWHKPNPMPETVYDRPSTAHEYIFMFTKSARYFYASDEAREPVTGNAHDRGDGKNKKVRAPMGWDTTKGEGAHGKVHRRGRGNDGTRPKQNESWSGSCNKLVDSRNWRSVWTIPIEPFSGAHFATFPTAIPRRCIIAGCPKFGTVLDPFGGSGTTGEVALELGRSAILCELNPAYVKIMRRRCETTLGLPFP